MSDNELKCGYCGLPFDEEPSGYCRHLDKHLATQRDNALRRIAQLEAAVDAAQIDEVTRLAKQAEWARAMLENEQLKAEVERLRGATRWIPVGERLPEVRDRSYLCVVDVRFDRYVIPRFFRPDGTWNDNHVTHWMPIPPPPHHP